VLLYILKIHVLAQRNPRLVLDLSVTFAGAFAVVVAGAITGVIGMHVPIRINQSLVHFGTRLHVIHRIFARVVTQFRWSYGRFLLESGSIVTGVLDLFPFATTQENYYDH
jgi:hypothetical protein